MALPIFTKAGAAGSPLELEKARFLPKNEPIDPRQLIGVAGGGQVKVADVGTEEQFYIIILNRIGKTNRDAILAFLQDSNVNYSLNTFTFTDEDSNTHTVRLWNTKGLDLPQVKGGSLYNIRLTLREEIT